MGKFKFYLIAAALVGTLISCNKSDSVEYATLQDYGVQYGYDIAVIEDFLKTHYIKEIVDAPGTVADQDIVFDTISDPATQQAIWDSPLLKSFEIERNDMMYTIYYIQQREGVGTSPSRVDNVFTAYDGYYLRMGSEPTRFEYTPIPTQSFALYQTIQGWAEVFPKFKTGVLQNENGPDPEYYSDFGAGVMFLPSALAYYNSATSTIPSYAQLMFKFKLYDMTRSDADNDGILSIDEDLNGNGIFTDDDTDGDGIPNYLDSDDDGDGMLTKAEITKADGTLYDFNAIPSCSGDVVDPNRVKRHLDISCRINESL